MFIFQTKDNVFVTVVISVQYQVVEESVKDAWYYVARTPHPQRTRPPNRLGRVDV